MMVFSFRAQLASTKKKTIMTGPRHARALYYRFYQVALNIQKKLNTSEFLIFMEGWHGGLFFSRAACEHEKKTTMTGPRGVRVLYRQFYQLALNFRQFRRNLDYAIAASRLH